MPFAAQGYCSTPRCPNKAEYKGRCTEHARAQERTRYNADTRKWYCTLAWQTLRQMVLADEPICMACHQEASTEVDHIIPHRGDYTMFFNQSNLQGLCATCHGQKTARGE